jgi:membrane protease YdiL (CAAX protease family)
LGGSQILAETPQKIREKLSLFHSETAARYLLLGLFLAGIHSLMEEYYWRWFVFGELRGRVPVALAIALSSLAFMAHHVVVLAVYFPGHLVAAALPFALCVAIGGAAWAWLYQRTGTIYSCWISHLLVDTAILAVGYHMVFASSVA